MSTRAESRAAKNAAREVFGDTRIAAIQTRAAVKRSRENAIQDATRSWPKVQVPPSQQR